MGVSDQRHAPAALPPGKVPVPVVQKYKSPDIIITACNTITLEVTEKLISKYCVCVCVSAVKDEILSTADYDPSEVIKCRTVHFSLN